VQVALQQVEVLEMQLERARMDATIDAARAGQVEARI